MHIKTRLLVSVFILLPMISMAQEERLLELYAKSGMEIQIALMPQIVLEDFNHGAATHRRLIEMPPPKVNALRAALTSAVAPVYIKKAILSEYGQRLSSEDIDKIRRWLDTSIGKKVHRLELEASTPEEFNDVNALEGERQMSPPALERREMIRQLDAAVKASETRLDLALNAQLLVAMALVAHLPEAKQPTSDQLWASVNNSRPLILSAIRVETRAALQFMYRSLTDTELKQYLDFALSSAGMRYHTATTTGLRKALRNGCYQWRGRAAAIIAHGFNRN